MRRVYVRALEGALKLCTPGPIVGGRALHPHAHESDV